MATLSIVIMTFNQEDKIEKALQSVKEFADEIIVVDNSSTDQTASIAKKYTKKVFKQKNDEDNIDGQKNYGFSKATKEWTLSLDADEQVTQALADEIKSVLQHASTISGYWIPRKNIIFGKTIEHTGWYPDYQLRLFQTGKGKYRDHRVHEAINIEGEKAYLHADLLHENYETIEQFLKRNLLIYAKNEAKTKTKEGYQFSSFDLIKFPTEEFISRFFSREGYKDGIHGLILSLLMGVYHLTIALYLWQENKFLQEPISLPQLRNQMKTVQRDMTYWMLSSQINSEKNPIKKTILKAKRKTV